MIKTYKISTEYAHLDNVENPGQYESNFISGPVAAGVNKIDDNENIVETLSHILQSQPASAFKDDGKSDTLVIMHDAYSSYDGLSYYASYNGKHVYKLIIQNIPASVKQNASGKTLDQIMAAAYNTEPRNPIIYIDTSVNSSAYTGINNFDIVNSTNNNLKEYVKDTSGFFASFEYNFLQNSDERQERGIPNNITNIIDYRDKLFKDSENNHFFTLSKLTESGEIINSDSPQYASGKTIFEKSRGNNVLLLSLDDHNTENNHWNLRYNDNGTNNGCLHIKDFTSYWNA